MRTPCALCALLALSVVFSGLLAASEAEPLPYPDMAGDVGEIVADEYYDPDRIHPEVMVREALQALEASDIAIDAIWEPPALKIVIGDDLREFEAPVPADLDDTMRILEWVRAALDHPRFEAKRQRELAYAMLNGALQSLDPHSLIIPPEPADDFAEEIEGEFFGIGAYLVERDGLISIERVMPDMPAERYGVEDGDVILGVDGEKTTGLSIGQTVRRIKGPKGTTVTLTVEREGHAEPLEIDVVRDRIEIITMRSHRHGDIGYVMMNEFNRHTAVMLHREIQRLKERGPLKGFVLDLRFNSGGLLQQAQLISNFFLGAGKEIVRTVSPRGNSEPVVASHHQFLEEPMLVLTSQGSASAAEILSGSLQLNGRAAVVGTETFGKGSVQTLFGLEDESRLKLTIQEYQLKDGISIQERGVEPDVVLLRHTVREDGSIDLVPYTLHREGDNEFALGDSGTYHHKTVYHLGWLADWKSVEDQAVHRVSHPQFRPDQEAQLVLELMADAVAAMSPETLAEARASGDLRQPLLEALADPVAARAEQEAEALAAHLAERHGMTWGRGTPIEAESLRGTYLGPERVTPGEAATLRFEVANTGDVTAGQLYGVVRADKASPFWEEEVLFGAIPAGKTRIGTLEFDVPPRLYPGQERFELVVRQEGRPHDDLAVIPVTMEIEQLPRPSFGYHWELIENQASDGRMGLDERVVVRVHLRNTGAGDSAPITAYVFKDDDHFVQLGEARFTLDPVPSGAEVSFDIPISVRSSVTVGSTTKTFEGQAIKLQFRAEEDFPPETDGRYRASIFHTIEVPVDDEVAGGHVRQPELALQAVERLPGNRLKLRIGVDDDNLDMIATFLGDDKIDLRTAERVAAGVYETEVELLEDEVTDIRIAAADDDEVLAWMTLRMWRDVDDEVLAEQDGGIDPQL